MRTDLEAGRSAAKVVAANSGWQVLTFAARAASGIGVAVLVARSGGPTALGVFQFALTLTMLLGFAVGFGLPNLVTREVARRPDMARTWLEAGLFLALVAGAAVTALFFLGTHVVPTSPDLAFAILLGAIALVFDASARLEFSVFWAWERMRLEAVATSLQEAGFLAGSIYALHAGYGVRGVMLSYALSRFLGALIGYGMAASRLSVAPLPRPHSGFLMTMVRRSVPFAFDDALSLAYIRIDAVLLGAIKGPAAVGYYQAGTNLVLYLNVLARVLNNSLFPRMSKAWPGRPEVLRRLRDASLRVVSGVGIPLTVGSILLAPRIFRFLYGARFDRAVLCYQILAIVIAVRMVGHTLGTTLTAANRQTPRTVVVAVAAGLNIALNLVVLPRWSYLGAAVTTVITEVAVFSAYAVLARKVVGPSQLGSATFLPAAACVPMGAAVLLTRHAPLAVPVVLGAASYVVALAGLALTRMPTGSPRTPRAAAASFLGESV